MQSLFWISVLLLFYTYIGYGLLLFLCTALFKRKGTAADGFLPNLTFIVPAYNEEGIIRQKIENTLALAYPEEKISFLFVTDGSTDGTPEIIGAFPQLQVLHQSRRGGKSAAINRAMQTVKTPVVVFSDANTMVHPQSLQKMVSHYADETVGGVSGEKRIKPEATSLVSFGERLYWQYESLLKKAAGEFYTLVGAAGELFSIRTALFQPLNEAIILDDFVLSANVCLQGRRFVYEAEAFGVEASSASLQEERKRKVRISAGCYQALVALPGLLNPIKNVRLFLQYLSHRVLRWVVCPLALPVLFLSNVCLFAKADSSFYAFTFWGQCIFYFLALLGWLFPLRRTWSKPLLVPGYFLFMVLSQYAGFYRFITGKQSVFWEKARRGTGIEKKQNF
jgi:biofilm PGA synthesis N-glycosyltransferase PgaC